MIYYVRKIITYFSLFGFIVISMAILTTYLPFWLNTASLTPHIINKKEIIDSKEISLKETISLTADNSKNFTHNPVSISLSNDSLNTKLGVIIVPYFEPKKQDWEILYAEADKYPNIIRYVIINPCSGPCDEPLSSDWQQIISKLKSRNIKTLGYIFDTFQNKKNIDYYMIEPQITTDGIFFDNEGSSNTIDKFRQYANYVHELGGIVYINPGFNYSYLDNYLKEGLVDVINMYEFESSKSHHINLEDDLQPQQISVIIGDVFTISEMKQMLYQLSQSGVGIIYVYSDSYYQLPSFFPELIKEAADITIDKIN
jgi:hypothetical protein